MGINAVSLSLQLRLYLVYRFLDTISYLPRFSHVTMNTSILFCFSCDWRTDVLW